MPNHVTENRHHPYYHNQMECFSRRSHQPPCREPLTIPTALTARFTALLPPPLLSPKPLAARSFSPISDTRIVTRITNSVVVALWAWAHTRGQWLNAYEPHRLRCFEGSKSKKHQKQQKWGAGKEYNGLWFTVRKRIMRLGCALLLVLFSPG